MDASYFCLFVLASFFPFSFAFFFVFQQRKIRFLLNANEIRYSM